MLIAKDLVQQGLKIAGSGETIELEIEQEEPFDDISAEMYT